MSAGALSGPAPSAPTEPLTQAPHQGAVEPLAEFVQAAVDTNRARWDVARKARKFLGPAFELVRILKSRPEFVGLSVDAAARLAERAVPNVWSQIPSTTSLGVVVDTVASFMAAWHEVRHPEGAPSKINRRLRSATKRVAASPPGPDDFGPTLAHPRFETLRAFLAILQELQWDYGSEPFPLPQTMAGEILGVHQTMIGVWLGNAASEGFLTQVTAAVPRVKAAEYRFRSYQAREPANHENQVNRENPRTREP